ncbi:MAG: hypothetical protein QXZ44_03690 [Ferroplasma sp.]
MNFKKHYKIIISIIIIIILVSTSIIYININHPNKIIYEPNENHYNIKYAMLSKVYTIKNQSLSSYEIFNGKKVYLNSTILITRLLPMPPYNQDILLSTFFISVNLSKNDVKNINKLEIDGLYNFHRHDEQEVVMYHLYNITKEVLSGSCVETERLNLNANNNDYYYRASCSYYAGNPNSANITVTVSANPDFYDRFVIHTEECTSICGAVTAPPGYLRDSSYNGSIYIENMNNSHINTIDIVEGRFYYFIKPDTEYQMYYNDNGTIKLLEPYNSEGNPISNFTIPNADGTAQFAIHSSEL